jgi:hypothetical protein
LKAGRQAEYGKYNEEPLENIVEPALDIYEVRLQKTELK